MIRIPPTSPVSPQPPERKKSKTSLFFDLPQIPAKMRKNDRMQEFSMMQWLQVEKMDNLSLQLHDLTARVIASYDKQGRTVDPEIEQALKVFAEAYLKSLEEQSPYPLDPAYANQIKMQIYRDAERFQERMARGYQILMRELKQR